MSPPDAKGGYSSTPRHIRSGLAGGSISSDVRLDHGPKNTGRVSTFSLVSPRRYAVMAVRGPPAVDAPEYRI